MVKIVENEESRVKTVENEESRVRVYDGTRDADENDDGMENEKKIKYFERMMNRCVKENGSYLFAMLLLDEAKKAVEGRSWGDTEKGRDERFKEANYTIMKSAFNRGELLPFRDDASLRDAFDAAMELDEMDWDWGFKTEADAGFVPRMPQALMNLYKSRIGAETKSVLIVEAEKFYPFLKGEEGIIEQNKDKRFVLTTHNDINREVLQAALREFDNVDIKVADVYSTNFAKRNIVLIFALPSGRDTSMDSTSATIAAVNNLMSCLNEGGRLLVTVPGKVIGSSRDECRDFRRKISKEYKLNEMSELPGMLFDYTALKTCFLDIEKAVPADDDDVAVRRYALNFAAGDGSNDSLRPRRLGWRGRRNDRAAEITVKEEVTVKAEELWNYEEWNIFKMLSAKDAAYRVFYESSVPKVKLETVASVVRGRAIYERGSEGDIGVLSISNLTEDGINFKKLDRIKADDKERLALYYLKDGDLLLPARGTAIKTAVFRDPGFTCVASVNLIVIRPKDNPAKKDGQELPRLNPVYLKIFLDSDLGKEFLRGMQQGDRLMNLSHRDLEMLEIPLPSKEEQDEKAKEYEKEYEIYRKAVDDAAEHWERVKEGLQKF